MMKSETTPLELLVIFAMIPVSWLTKALMLFWLWAWFLVPVGVPGITYAQALGLGLLASALTQSAHTIPKEHKLSDERPIMQAFIVPAAHLLCLGIGWLYYFGMTMGW